MAFHGAVAAMAVVAVAGDAVAEIRRLISPE